MLFLKKHRRKLFLLAVLFVVWFFSLSNPLFKDPLSYILLDREGDLLGARIASDGQWRFHRIVLVDKAGNREEMSFEVLGK